MKRKLLFFLTALIVAIVVLITWAVVAERRETRRLAERLVTDSIEWGEKPHTRETHVKDATDGTFGDLAQPHLTRLRNSPHTLSLSFFEDCKAGWQMQTTYGDLPTSCHNIVSLDWEPAKGLLHATHARTATTPDGLSLLVDMGTRAGNVGASPWIAVLHAGRISALTANDALSRGDVQRALDICVDVLALGRDVTVGGGLIGAASGAGLQELVLPVCSAAIVKATPAQRARVERQVERIEDGEVPLSRILREEALFLQLMAYAPVLSDPQVERLPERARTLVVESRKQVALEGLAGEQLLRNAWPKYVEHMDSVIAAADLPRAERNAKLAEADRLLTDSLNPVLQIASPDFTRLAGRYDRKELALSSLLIVIAACDHRDETGRWPSSIAEVEAELPRNLSPFSRATLSLSLSGDKLTLSTRDDIFDALILAP